LADQDLLHEVGLGYLLQRPGGLQAVEDWADSLSLGEQQRLAFARLFCHDPAFAIIDVSGRHCFKRPILYSRTSSLRHDAPGEPGVSCDSCYPSTQEGTSALDVALEEHCLRRCIARGIGMVSVGHRPTLIPFHTHMLTLQRGGKYVPVQAESEPAVRVHIRVT
jgi:putative ATP-binding cassette transporter